MNFFNKLLNRKKLKISDTDMNWERNDNEGYYNDSQFKENTQNDQNYEYKNNSNTY